MTKNMSRSEVKEEAKKLDAAFIEKLSKLTQKAPETSPFDEMAAYQSGRGVHTSRHEITAENSDTVLTHAIQHLRRTQLNCRTWTMPVGDEQAINLMLDLQR